MGLEIIAGNTETDCKYVLTTWYKARGEIQFAIDQIEKYTGKWQLKGFNGCVAVFTSYEPSLYHPTYKKYKKFVVKEVT